MKHYKEFTITSDPFIPEIISGILWELEISGINEEVNCLKVFCDEGSNIKIENISNLLNKLINEKMLRTFNVEENILEEKNWNQEWESSVNVIEISDRIVIKPTFRDYKSKADQIVISIDPKMSFGTGEHQTTKLVVLFLEKYIKPGMKILDVGSGTGILAIAGIKLGAEKAIAVDNDEWCYDNGKENCQLNNVTDKVDVRLGEINSIKENDFGLIAANIQKNILIDIAGELKMRLKDKGILILSGLLVSDEADIKNIYEKFDFKIIEKNQIGEWIALVLK